MAKILRYSTAQINVECETLFKTFCSSYSEKCPSEYNVMCPSEHNAGISMELKQNCSSHTPPTSSKTYPYPKREHNGAVDPQNASLLQIYQT